MSRRLLVVNQQRDDITDPDDEFRGLAPKSLSKSCDKDGSCEPPENAWAYLPDVEVCEMFACTCPYDTAGRSLILSALVISIESACLVVRDWMQSPAGSSVLVYYEKVRTRIICMHFFAG